MIEWEDLIDSIRVDEVLNALGINITEIRKGEHWSSCPLPSHPGADASPSWSINEDTLLYNCFICGGGPLPLLVAEMEDYETDEYASRWDQALTWLLPYSDADVDSDQGFMEQLERYLERSEERPKRTRRQELPFYSPKVIERLELAPVELLAKWHITRPETIEHFGIRFDPERHRMKPGKGDYTGPALVIPHYFGGELVGFQERWLDEPPKWIPKYTNSENFPKALTLYNWDGAVEEARRGLPVIVVESTLTTCRLWEIGYTAVATFGASVRDEQIRLLSGLHSGVILAFDADPDFLNAKGKTVTGAGMKAFTSTANSLTELVPVEIVISEADDKEDLADKEDEEVHRLIEGRKRVFTEIGSRSNARVA